MVEVPSADLGRTRAFLSYDSLSDVNAIDSKRQFKHAHEEFYVPSATFHNRALMSGIDAESASQMCNELMKNGYIGLVEMEIINPRHGVNQIRGRPIILA